MSNPETLALVKDTVQGMSAELGYPFLSNVGEDTELLGGASGVDSLSVVIIVAQVEVAVEKRFAKRVVLADERAMSRRSSPYRTVGTLAELVAERLGE
jgi:acyl carrier protein